MIQVKKDIWILEGEIVDFYGFAYPTRSVVIKLKNGELWVWSPIRLSEKIVKMLNSLGEVKHLVSPNKLHHLYLHEWKQTFSEAKLWGPQSTIDKKQDLIFEHPLDDKSPLAWEYEIDQYWLNGSFLFDEIVFFHRASQTAIFADLTENFTDQFLKKNWKGWKRLLAKIWKITEPYGYAPLELRFTWRKRKQDRKKIQALLKQNPECVIMAHGKWQKECGYDYIRKAFKWLGV